MQASVIQPAPNVRTVAWLEKLFSVKSAEEGGVVRRSVRSVERDIGREVLAEAARARGFHLVECGGQFIVICNPGLLKVVR